MRKSLRISLFLFVSLFLFHSMLAAMPTIDKAKADLLRNWKQKFAADTIVAVEKSKTGYGKPWNVDRGFVRPGVKKIVRYYPYKLVFKRGGAPMVADVQVMYQQIGGGAWIYVGILGPEDIMSGKAPAKAKAGQEPLDQEILQQLFTEIFLEYPSRYIDSGPEKPMQVTKTEFKQTDFREFSGGFEYSYDIVFFIKDGSQKNFRCKNYTFVSYKRDGQWKGRIDQRQFAKCQKQ